MRSSLVPLNSAASSRPGPHRFAFICVHLGSSVVPLTCVRLSAEANLPRPYSFCLSFRICSKICSAHPGGSGPLLKSNFIPNANFHRSIHKIPVPT